MKSVTQFDYLFRLSTSSHNNNSSSNPFNEGLC